MEHEANSILSISISSTLPVEKVVWTAAVLTENSAKKVLTI